VHQAVEQHAAAEAPCDEHDRCVVTDPADNGQGLGHRPDDQIPGWFMQVHDRICKPPGNDSCLDTATPWRRVLDSNIPDS